MSGRMPAVLGALLLLGCGASRSELRSQSRMEGRYRLGELPTSWEKQRPGGADRAWFNDAFSSTIYADSNCAERFQDSPLHDLMTHLTAGIAVGAPVREESLTLDNRAALLRVYSGLLDGVELKVSVVVLKKNQCTYDMLYLAPSSTFEAGWSDFVGVISGFQVMR